MRTVIVGLALMCFAMPVGAQDDVRPIQPDAARQLDVTVGESSVASTGITPGGYGVVLGAQRYPLPGAARIETFARAVRDDDSSGDIVMELEEPVARKSAWAVVDLQSGDFGTAVGPGFRPDVQRPGESAFEEDPESGEVRLRLASEVLQILLVRPGVGAWALRAYDGGRGDGDLAPDGLIHLSFPSLEPLAPEFPELAELQPGDRIAAVDENQLTVYLLRGSEAPVTR